VKPHYGWLIVDTRQAGALHNVRHKCMTIFDGVSNVFEVHGLICTDGH